MILQGSQRGGARNLALHLLKSENEHVTLHELRGFVSDNLPGAFKEAYALSRGTRAKQFLFSLSLNPPPSEQVPTEVFEDAIARVERKLGLAGQPRAIVFHEKQGRRHAHAVWSRIDATAMKAIPLAFTKRKLMELSRDLFLEHGWPMPKGLMHSEARDPRNFTLAEWQQARRSGKDPKAIKAVFQDCWAVSRDAQGFANALLARGYILAKGDKRGFVAVDYKGEIFAVPKWVGAKAKDVRAKLGDPTGLPSIPEAKVKLAGEMERHLAELQAREQSAITERLRTLEDKRTLMVQQHRHKRRFLEAAQQARWQEEAQRRQARFARGLRGLLERVTGRRRKISQENECEAALARQRDQRETDALIFAQLSERRTLQARMDRLRGFAARREQGLEYDRSRFEAIRQSEQDRFQTPSAPSTSKGRDR